MFFQARLNYVQLIIGVLHFAYIHSAINITKYLLMGGYCCVFLVLTEITDIKF